VEIFLLKVFKHLSTYATNPIAVRANTAGDTTTLRAFRRRNARAILTI
jgi:hypothetical protein